jgi:hypothetical protein
MIAAPISRVLAFAVLLAIGASVTPARAQTDWVNLGTGSWFDPANWSAGLPPSIQTTVGNGGTAQITLPGADAGPTLNINGGSTVDLQLGTTLTAGMINLGPSGTLLISGSTAGLDPSTPLNFAGGTLRATLTGPPLTNNITFADGTTNTIAAGAGQTLTLQPSNFVLGTVTGATANFGSATDSGTVVLTLLGYRPWHLDPP